MPSRGSLLALFALSVTVAGMDRATSPGHVLAQSPDRVLPTAAGAFPSGLSGTIVFQSDKPGRPGIFTLDLRTGTVRHLSGSPGWTEGAARWSPDGSQIAFKSNRAHFEGASPESGDADLDLYVMNADGSGRRRVTTGPANEEDPVWAPDGTSLFFSSDADSRGDLYRVWLADGRIERLTRHFVGRAIMPNVSPDGARVAFAAQTLRLGQFWVYQVHLLDVASGKTSPLGASGGACWPSWSRDSRRLANVLLSEGRPSAIEVRDVASGAITRVVEDATLWSYYPEWSPDERHLAFSVSPAHHEGEDWDLAVYNFESKRFVRLTEGPGNDRLPDWKP